MTDQTDDEVVTRKFPVTSIEKTDPPEGAENEDTTFVVGIGAKF